MFKTIAMHLRGSANAASENLADEGAMRLLEQQLRDTVAAAEQARLALATAHRISPSEIELHRATLQHTERRLAVINRSWRIIRSVALEKTMRNQAIMMANPDTSRLRCDGSS